MQRNLGRWSAQPPGSAKPSPANETVPEQNPMRAPDYWKSHYVTSADRAEIDLALKHARLNIGGESLELIYFLNAPDAPNVLVSQGSGGHSYVFAELAYRIHLWGFNVFIMPKHGGRTVNQLMSRHLEVLQYIRREFNDRIGLYGEGLGGYVAFYLALAHGPIVSLICQNAPAIVTEPAYHQALLNDHGPWARSVRRRRSCFRCSGHWPQLAQ